MICDLKQISDIAVFEYFYDFVPFNDSLFNIENY